MGVLPPFLQDGKLHNICLVLEGYEESSAKIPQCICRPKAAVSRRERSSR